MPPRKILLLIGQLSCGGAERQAVNLAKAVDARRFAVRLAVLSPLVHLGGELQAAGIPLQVMEKRGRFDLRPAFQLAAFMRRQGIELLQTYLYSANVIGMLAAALSRVPLIVCERSAPPHLHLEKRVVYGLGQLLAERVLVNGASVARLLRREARIHPARLMLIANGVDVTAFRARPGSCPAPTTADGCRHFTVGAVGRLVPVKNYELLIRAAALLRAAGIGARLEIVGREDSDGRLSYGAALHDLCSQLGLQGSVCFAGGRDDVALRLAGFDVFAQASHWEGTSNALLEAMAASLPAVVSDAGDGGRIVAEADCGYVVERTPQAFAAALERLAASPQLRRRLGQRAAAYVARHFSLQRLAADTEALWTSILDRSGNRR